MSKYLIAYHANCQDGFFAASFANNFLKNKAEHVVTHPIEYGSDANLGFKGDLSEFSRIYFVDFCPSTDVLRALLEDEDREIIILDHHETSKANVDALEVSQYANLHVVFAKQLSGTGLVAALGHTVHLIPLLRPEVPDSMSAQLRGDYDYYTNTPDVVDRINVYALNKQAELIQARDLWSAGELRMQGIYFGTYVETKGLMKLKPESLFDLLPDDRLEEILEIGKEHYARMYATCEALHKTAANRTVFTDIGEVQIIIAPCPSAYTDIFGEIGYSKNATPTIVVGVTIDEAKQIIKLGLRSHRDVHVHNLAKAIWGGGGHPNSSGARINTTLYNSYAILDAMQKYILENPEDVIKVIQRETV